jgi:hypothetical protein
VQDIVAIMVVDGCNKVGSWLDTVAIDVSHDITNSYQLTMPLPNLENSAFLQTG